MRTIAFERGSMRPRIWLPRGVGRPKAKWTKSECERMWEEIQKDLTVKTRYKEDDAEQGKRIQEFAKDKITRKA